jgi:hypothetical protein
MHDANGQLSIPTQLALGFKGKNAVPATSLYYVYNVSKQQPTGVTHN